LSIRIPFKADPLLYPCKLYSPGLPPTKLKVTLVLFTTYEELLYFNVGTSQVIFTSKVSLTAEAFSEGFGFNVIVIYPSL
jgi:hypothetical protein